MVPRNRIQRNVRPGIELGYDNENGLGDDGSLSGSDEFSERNENHATSSMIDGDEADEIEESDDVNVESDSDSTENGLQNEISNVSFGALLQAEDGLSRKRKRGVDHSAEHEAKLDAVRARLQQLRESGKVESGSHSERQRKVDRSRVDQGDAARHEVSESKSRPRIQEDESDVTSDDDDSDSAPSEEEATPKSRSSKHAPTSQSSKRQVTRKRTVVAVPKRVIRDPRFDALHQGNVHSGNAEKAYGFLRDYQKAEIAELRSAIKQTKDVDANEKLKRKVVSLENRLKSKEAKEREQEILRNHRKEEKEKIQQGKKPFYLKQKDVKQKALVQKFESMKSKDREKLMERRRRKEGQKEKKRMPEARRTAG